MSVFRLGKELIFPSPFLADPDGLLAVGGDLSVERLVLAYRSGVFPGTTKANPSSGGRPALG
jgi:leucyl/phenylalanyl-tRNA--protein transferase